LRHEDDAEHEQDAVDGVGGADVIGAEPDAQASVSDSVNSEPTLGPNIE